MLHVGLVCPGPSADRHFQGAGVELWAQAVRWIFKGWSIFTSRCFVQDGNILLLLSKPKNRSGKFLPRSTILIDFQRMMARKKATATFRKLTLDLEDLKRLCSCFNPSKVLGFQSSVQFLKPFSVEPVTNKPSPINTRHLLCCEEA